MQDFLDVIALVSGGSSGIGLALARELVARGARVAITGTNREKLRAAAASFADPRTVLPLTFDVTAESGWKEAIDRVEREWGAIRFLALNAGVGMGGERIEDVPVATWRWALEVNVVGVALGLRQCLPRMRRLGVEAHVLVTASNAGVWRTPTCGPYIATKAAVVAIAETLRLELADSPIRVSVLLPGAVHTDLPQTSARSAPVTMEREVLDAMNGFLATGLEPGDVATFALDRIAAGAFYIFTHQQDNDEVATRHAEMAGAMAVTLQR